MLFQDSNLNPLLLLFLLLFLSVCLFFKTNYFILTELFNKIFMQKNTTTTLPSHKPQENPQIIKKDEKCMVRWCDIIHLGISISYTKWEILSSSYSLSDLLLLYARLMILFGGLMFSDPSQISWWFSNIG